jgi:hypothetical protein
LVLLSLLVLQCFLSGARPPDIRCMLSTAPRSLSTGGCAGVCSTQMLSEETANVRQSANISAAENSGARHRHQRSPQHQGKTHKTTAACSSRNNNREAAGTPVGTGTKNQNNVKASHSNSQQSQDKTTTEQQGEQLKDTERAAAMSRSVVLGSTERPEGQCESRTNRHSVNHAPIDTV